MPLVSPSEQVGVMIRSSKSRALRAFAWTASMETRDIPIPKAGPFRRLTTGRYQLDGSGERFIVQDGKDVITVYETRARRQFAPWQTGADRGFWTAARPRCCFVGTVVLFVFRLMGALRWRLIRCRVQECFA